MQDTVLVVENDESLRECYDYLLADAGFHAECVADGRAGLDRLLDGLKPRAVLVDLLMPVMDGRSFINALSKLPEPVSRTPVLVVTGMRGAALPATVPVLYKPFGDVEFLEALRAVISPEEVRLHA